MTELEKRCDRLRGNINKTAQEVKILKQHPECGIDGSTEEIELKGEMIANLMLSFRHLEDARMRLGKVMQQIQGGVSVFDRPEMRKAAGLDNPGIKL